MLWKSRAELHEALGDKDIPGINESSEADYQRLIDESKVWWELLRKLKVRKLRSWFQLSIPKEFRSTNQPGTTESQAVQEVSNNPYEQGKRVSWLLTQLLSHQLKVHKGCRALLLVRLAALNGPGKVLNQGPGASVQGGHQLFRRTQMKKKKMACKNSTMAQVKMTMRWEKMMVRPKNVCS